MLAQPAEIVTYPAGLVLCGIRLRRTAAQICFATSTAPAAGVLGRMTANSSPPILATRSPGRVTTSNAASAICFRQLSPRGCPYVSLYDLNQSDVQQQEATAASSFAHAAPPFVAWALVESPPVGEPGQRVGDRQCLERGVRLFSTLEFPRLLRPFSRPRCRAPCSESRLQRRWSDRAPDEDSLRPRRTPRACCLLGTPAGRRRRPLADCGQSPQLCRDPQDGQARGYSYRAILLAAILPMLNRMPIHNSGFRQSRPG